MNKKAIYSYIKIASGILAGAFIGEWIGIYKEELIKTKTLTDLNKSIFLILGIIFIVITVYSDRRETRKISKAKTDIIKDSLTAYCAEFFRNVSSNDYQICAKILVKEKNIVRTPYYINEGVNPAIRSHRRADFSDIGEMFSGKRTEVCKLITYDDWLEQDEYYRNEVPDSLRGIIAIPIYSTNKADSSKILGILEFDIFAQREGLNMDKDSFKSLSSWERIISLRKYSNVIANMLEL